jgi:hypothetical protein
LVALVQPGLANTRDEVMSRAFSCGIVGDSRTWLDCYYGAAQPLRQSLNLQPANSAQIALAAHPPTGAVTEEEAKAREDILYSVMACRSMKSDHDWLNCFYGAAQPMRARLGLLPNPNALSSSRAEEGSKVSSIGLGVGSSQEIERSAAGPAGISSQAGPNAEKREIVSRMTSYTFDRYGIFSVSLENGQLWRQLPGDTSFAHWKGAPGEHVVRISRGFLGSFNLQVDHNLGMFKVLRVK